MRQLEHSCYNIIKPLAVVFGIGILLSLTPLLLALGLILLAVSGLGLAGLFIWMIQLQKQPHTKVNCPYCTNPNTVFAGKTQFNCDFCERPIRMTENGAPVPADPAFANAKPTSVFDTPGSA